MKKNPHTFFTDIVFFKLNDEQKIDIHNFMNIYNRFYTINYTFKENIQNLEEFQNKNTLIVSNNLKFSDKIINLGLIFQLSLDDFFLYFNDLFQFKNFKENTIAVLAFLS